jgi:hypothetical protein
MGCNNVILFMTDGGINEGLTSSKLYEYIEEENNSTSATIFTYSIGSGSDDEVPKKISCISDGIWTKV